MTASILIIDDNEQNIKVLEAKLLHEYYTVYTANNGPAGLNILAENKIDLILLDVMMPEMDGFEVCNQIKQNPDTAHIPVIIITALTDIESRVKGLAKGADEFLSKPIQNIPLLPRVKSLTRMKMLIDELRLRNKTNQELGESIVEVHDNFQNCKILFINDDIVQARNINTALSQVTKNIEVITNPNEINNYDSYTPDLVIISCQLDNADPLRIVSILMSKDNFKYSIFMMMAEEESDQVIRGIELGVNDYFLATADKNELIARIRTQLRRKKYQDNLRNSLEQSVNLSIQDSLTGLFNRRYLDMHIKQMMMNARDHGAHLSIIMVDIDHFKEVNDTYGHQEGDAILKQFTAIIKNSLRVTDLVARYGGEEFVVLLGDTPLKDAEMIAEKIRHNIESADFKLLNDAVTLKKTASIGVTEYIYEEPVESFFERVDSVLYKAKNTGRNKIIVASVDEPQKNKRQIELRKNYIHQEKAN